MANGAEPTGGMTTRSGRSVLVTPSGKVVGSAARPSGGRSGRGIDKPDKPTSDEQKRQNELAEIKRKEELRQQQISQGISRLEEKLRSGRLSERQKFVIEAKIVNLRESSAQQSLPMSTRQSLDIRTRQRQEVDNQVPFQMMVAEAQRQQFTPTPRGQARIEKIRQQELIERQKTFGQLIREGDIPAATRRGFFAVGEVVQKKVASPITQKVTGVRPTPSQEKVLGEGVGGVFLFGGLLPAAGARGTAQRTESEFVFDFTTGQFVKKKEVQRYLADKLLRDFDKAYNRGGSREVARKLNELVRGKKDIRGIENLLENLRSKGYIKSYVVNTRTGQFSIGTPQAQTFKPIEVTIDVPNVPNLRYVGVTGSTTQTLQGRVAMRGARQFEVLSTSQDVFVRQRSGERSLSGLASALQTRQTTGQTTLQATGQATGQLQVPRQITDQATSQATQQTTIQTTTQTGLRPTPRTPTRRIPKPIIFPLLGGSTTFGTGTLATPTGQGYIPQVRSKGKWVSLLKKALSLREARALAADVVDNTISAQLRAVKSKKAISKLKSPPRLQQQKFRNFKVVGGVQKPLKDFGLIERRGSRIDTVGEKKELSVARYLKGSSFGRKSKVTKRRRGFL